MTPPLCEKNPGKGVCPLALRRENRLKHFRADNSYRDNLCRGSFFMLDYLLVGLGGAIGTIGRFRWNGVASRRFGEMFPWGKMVINDPPHEAVLLRIFMGESDRWKPQPLCEALV